MGRNRAYHSKAAMRTFFCRQVEVMMGKRVDQIRCNGMSLWTTPLSRRVVYGLIHVNKLVKITNGFNRHGGLENRLVVIKNEPPSQQASLLNIGQLLECPGEE